MSKNDKKYLKIVLDPIRVSAEYKPKFGQGSKGGGLSLKKFQSLYQSDPFYCWFGLDNPLMYTAHKVAGGMTSVYRQIGIGCEKLFRAILQDCLGLSVEDSSWSYEAHTADGRVRKLHLDGRVPLDKIKDKVALRKFRQWMKDSASLIQIDSDILLHYRAEKWAVITGVTGTSEPLLSTYDFLEDVVGYDLAAFFSRNQEILKNEVDSVLRKLLKP